MKTSDLRSLLKWDKIVREERPIRPPEGSGAPMDDSFAVYRILPRDPEWPSINVVCWHEDSFEQLEFGAWDDYMIEGSDSDLMDALAFADDLILRKRLLIETLDGEGRCHSAGIHDPGEEPLSLSPETTTLKRAFFDREPVIEPVDESKYVESDGVRLLRSFHEEMDLGAGGTARISPLRWRGRGRPR